MRLVPNSITLHLGIEKPIRILQLTDVHLSLADDKDAEGMKAHAAERRREFCKEAGYPERDPVGYFEEAMEYSKNFDCTVITGDVIDFVSHANCETARNILLGRDYMFCAGNHEVCPKVGKPDSFERKEKITDEIQTIFRGDMIFESRIVGGVNVIAIDNSYYTWTEAQLEKLKFEVARGLPCILFCHVPLTYHNMRHEPSHKDLGVSEEYKRFVLSVNEYIINEPMIKAVFSGHMHITGVTDIGEKKDYTLGALFKGIVGEITID